jgi:hypothetical protein
MRVFLFLYQVNIGIFAGIVTMKPLYFASDKRDQHAYQNKQSTGRDICAAQGLG